MNALMLLGIIARMDTSDERFKRGLSMEEISADCVDTVDNLIVRARTAVKRQEVPTQNFVEGNWSFRRVTVGNFGTMETRTGFDIFPKGERSHWARRCSLRQSKSGCWIVSPRNGYSDAFATFADAKAHALELVITEAKR